MKVFMAKIGGFWLLVIVTKDLAFDITGFCILCCLLIFVKNCMCFAFLMLIFICYDCNELIINIFLNVFLFDLKIRLPCGKNSLQLSTGQSH